MPRNMPGPIKIRSRKQVNTEAEFDVFLLGISCFYEFAKALLRSTFVEIRGGGLRGQAQIWLSEKCSLLTDPGAGVVCPWPYVS